MRGRRLTIGGALAALPTLVVVLLGGAIGSSCLDPTEVMLTVTSDIPCAVDESGTYALTNTFIDLAGTDGWDTVANRATCARPLGSLALVPGGRDEVRLQVRGQVSNELGGTHEVVATRRVRFVSHQRLPITVSLSASCLDVACPDPQTQTCQDGVCVDNGVAPDGGLALDGGFVPDGIVVNPKDVRAEAIALDDSGLCPQLPNVGIATLWSFNEGMGSITTNSDNIATTLDVMNGVGFAKGGACQSALSVPANAAQKLQPISGTGSPSFGVGFFIKAPAGAFKGTPFLARGAAWSVAVLGGGQLELTLFVQGMPYKFSSDATITPDTAASVSIVVSTVTSAIKIGNAPATTFMAPVGAADAVNQATSVFGPVILDELQLRLK